MLLFKYPSRETSNVKILSRRHLGVVFFQGVASIKNNSSMMNAHDFSKKKRTEMTSRVC